jgi:large repetitive protein
MRLAAILCSVLCAILIGTALTAPVAASGAAPATKKKAKRCAKKHRGKKARKCKKKHKRHKKPHRNPPTTVPITPPPTGEQTKSPPDADKDGIVDNADNCPTTYNPDQADADADGKGDVCDPCPAQPGPCAATVYEVNKGQFAGGSELKIVDVVVTAVASSKETVFVETPEGEVSFEGRDFSGLMIDTSALAPGEVPAVGDSVEVEGFVAETSVAPLLEAEAFTVTATGKTLTPWTVTLEEIEKGQPTAAALNGLLVRVAGLKLTATAAHTWTVVEPLVPGSSVTVGDAIIGSLPGDSEGQEYTEIVGIAQPPGLSQLLPRSLGDIVET